MGPSAIARLGIKRLDDSGHILPWQNMTAVIEPFYPKAGNGRRPYPLETMLRIHCMQ
ncbi:hypothetical protein M1900_28885, partial [Klebsiella pneumoniae]|nr:hypothetical protein [Klebsiella pneumoniae]MDZ2346543.1 hypothetical protein [Klebsiella pneumoniae]